TATTRFGQASSRYQRDRRPGLPVAPAYGTIWLVIERPFKSGGRSPGWPFPCEEAGRMAVDRSVDLDLNRIDTLIAEEEAALEPKHRASIAYRAIAERFIAGGVASSWQDSRPHAIFID